MPGLTPWLTSSAPSPKPRRTCARLPQLFDREAEAGELLAHRPLLRLVFDDLTAWEGLAHTPHQVFLEHRESGARAAGRLGIAHHSIRAERETQQTRVGEQAWSRLV